MHKIDWTKIRDFFWPVLEKENNERTMNTVVLENYSFVDQENLEQSIHIALEYARDENNRRASIENKAALFISAFSVAVTILVSLITDFILNIDSYPIIFIGIIIVFVSIVIVYLCRATLYAIDALSRKTYSTIGIPRYLYSGDPNYKEKLFLGIKNCVYSNFKAINQKVDSMTMAQEFFKCAVRTVIVLVFFLVIFFIVA